MRCERCGGMLNTQFHTFQGVPLCEDCLVLVHKVFRGLRGHLHRLERVGTDLIEASLRSGEHLTTEELLRKLKNAL